MAVSQREQRNVVAARFLADDFKVDMRKLLNAKDLTSLSTVKAMRSSESTHPGGGHIKMDPDGARQSSVRSADKADWACKALRQLEGAFCTVVQAQE
jgi:hypothetical protein